MSLAHLSDDDIFHALEELATHSGRYWAGTDADGKPVYKAKKRPIAPATVNRRFEYTIWFDLVDVKAVEIATLARDGVNALSINAPSKQAVVCACSSGVGAPALHAGCRRFDRVSAYHLPRPAVSDGHFSARAWRPNFWGNCGGRAVHPRAI